MSYTPNKGDEVYNAEGELGLYVTTAKGGGHIVQPMLEDGDGVTEPAGHYVDGVAIWPQVYMQPPQPMLDDKIAEQAQRLAALRREIHEAEAQKRQVDREQAALRGRLAQHKALQYVDDYIAGKFTLFVRFPDYGVPTIETAAECLANDDRRDKGQKLLSLFGDTKGELQWRINKYSDGSGHWSEVYPVPDQAAGVAEIRARYEAAVAAWRECPGDRKHYGPAIEWTKLPREWLTPPDDVLAYIAERQRENAEKAAAKARADLAEIESKLAALSVT